MHSMFSGNSRVLRNVGLTVSLATAIFSGCGGGGGGDVIPAFTLPTSVAIADLNGDGVPDLVVAASTVAGAPPHPGFISVLTQIPGTPATFRAGDLNQDGRADIAVVDGEGVAVLFQDPQTPGRFLAPVRFGI